MKQKTFLKWPEAKGMFLREKKNKNTRSVYDYALRQYRHGLRGIDRDVDPITGDFRAIRDAIKLWLWEDEATVKSATMECRLKGVRMFYTWLVDEGYRDDDPAAGIKTQNVVWCSLNLFCEERIDITKCSTCRRHVPKEDTEGYIACNWPKAFAPRWKAMREDSQ